MTSAKPEFPELVVRPGHPLQWVVAVTVTIDAGGHVQHVGVSKSYGSTSQDHTIVRFALNAAVLKAAKAATFAPKLLDCKAVPSTYIYQVTFTGGP